MSEYDTVVAAIARAWDKAFDAALESGYDHKQAREAAHNATRELEAKRIGLLN